MNSIWKKRLLIGGISLLVVIAVFLVVLGITGVFTGNESEILEDEAITEDQIAPVDKASGKFNVLLLGVDVDGLRTDTIIIASYDLDDNKINMLSIPRDTRMYIGSKYQKINAAHAITQKGTIKGPQGAIEAVTRLTGIPINYYVEFNFSTFRDVIDALGGVDFYVPRDMDYEDPVQDLYIHLDKGQQHLDGDKAEQLVRFRRYPEGDIARVQMQQDFIKAVAEQKLNATIIEKIPDLFKTFKENIQTNFTLVDVMKYLPNLNDLSAENIEMFQLPGNYNDNDYGASYWICNMTELRKLVSENFGYSASNATIHSLDGSSKSKDRKIVRATPAPTMEVISITPNPSASSDPDSTASPDPSADPDTSASPGVNVRPTRNPTSDDNEDDDEKFGSDSDFDEEIIEETEKPEKTAAPTQKPAATEKPIETAATEPPVQESKPVENKVTRPTANPGVETAE